MHLQMLNNDRLHNRLVAPLPAEGAAQPPGRHAILPTPTVAPVDLKQVAAQQRKEIIF